MALDTLKYAKRLQEAGVPSQQAEVQADALWEAIEETLATKQDLQVLQQDFQMVRQELHEFDGRIDGRFKEAKAHTDGRFHLIYWMIGFDLALTAAILLKLFVG